MAAKNLSARAVRRIWGRTRLPAWWSGIDSDQPIGEIWFEDGAAREAELLVKYLFTSSRLSIQIHPDDRAARALGHARGKDEAWLVLAAEPDAVIGLGLKAAVSKDALRAAALDGSIETLIDWRPARAGDFFYSPAGTVHAIGAGLSLIEIQQNLDLTYRLYDYGRARELHLDDAIEVANPDPYDFDFVPYDLAPGRRIQVADAAFILERWSFEHSARLHSSDGQLRLVPVCDGGSLDGSALEAGSVWRVEGEAEFQGAYGMDLLVAYPGSNVRPDICVAI